MYKKIISSFFFALLLCVLQVFPAQTVYGKNAAVGKDSGNVVLAYVTSWSSVMPNPQVIHPTMTFAR